MICGWPRAMCLLLFGESFLRKISDFLDQPLCCQHTESRCVFWRTRRTNKRYTAENPPHTHTTNCQTDLYSKKSDSYNNIKTYCKLIVALCSNICYSHPIKLPSRRVSSSIESVFTLSFYFMCAQYICIYRMSLLFILATLAFSLTETKHQRWEINKKEEEPRTNDVKWVYI